MLDYIQLTDKKRKSNFPHISGIQNGAVEKSYMTSGLIITS
jgi:hypothetical protein